MRIIGTIDHPSLKISIFKMDNRVSVKFENALYEQTFKLGDDERFSTEEGVRQLVDQDFINQVQENFRLMHAARMGATGRAFPADHAPVYEEII